MLRRLVAALALVLAATHAYTPAVAAEPPGGSDIAQPPMDRSTEDRVLALDPANISAADVRDVLAHTPAPRIIRIRKKELSRFKPNCVSGAETQHFALIRP